MKTDIFKTEEQPEVLRAARVQAAELFQGNFWNEFKERLDIESRAGEMVEPRQTGAEGAP